MWTRTSTSSTPRNPGLPRRSSASLRSGSQRAGRKTSGSRTGSARTFAHGASRSRIPRTACAGEGSAADRLSCRRVVVVATDAGHVLAEKNELHRVFVDPLLAVDVVRWVEPGHERPRSELLLIEDADHAVRRQLPVRVAVAPADHAGDPPRLVVMDRGGGLWREAREHQGESIGVGL